MAKKRTPKQRSNQNAVKNSSRNIEKSKPEHNDNTQSSAEKKNEKIYDVSVSEDTAENLILCPPKGLVNLGNTCFFNSVMQNLCRTPGLRYMLQKTCEETKMTVHSDNIEPLHCDLVQMNNKLSRAFLNFLITMNADNTGLAGNKQRIRNKTESPRPLFGQICNVSPRFRGYQQQDSQELLQALLDGIKTEEIKSRKEAILSKLGLLRKKAKEVDLDSREKVKSYGQVVMKMPTVVDYIFGGKIVSSVLCDECGQITQVIEDFLDIPLPIVEGVHAHHVGDSKKSKKVAQSIENEINDVDDTIEPTTPSASKYALKKKRQQARKHNKRSRTKSQNSENNITSLKKGEGDCNVAKDDEITSLISKVENMEIEPLKGTDFSTNKASKSDIVPDEHNNMMDISCSIVELVIANAVNALLLRGETSEIDCRKTSISTINGCCKGGFNADKSAESCSANCHPVQGTDSLFCDGKDKLCQDECKDNDVKLVEDQMNGQCDNDLKKCSGDANQDERNSDDANLMHTKTNGVISLKSSDSEPSSGNDEKEVSGTDVSKTILLDNVSLFDIPAKKTEVKFTNFCAKLPTTLSPRYEPKNQECSIQSCLHKFTMAEMLTGQNKYGCEECTRQQTKGQQKPKTVYCNASKQMLIKVPPLILTLQLKRFQQSGRNLRKLGKRVEIPVEFDISPFCASDEESNHTDANGEIRYRIYGIVEHSGSLSRGHYTAYVNVRPENNNILKHLGKETDLTINTDEASEYDQWFHISDTSVSKTTLDRALNSNAYLLFYERIF